MSTITDISMSIMAHYVDLPEYEGRLIAFFRNKQPDYAGRFISQIMKWNHQKLEDTHDYIQWLFPLPEASMVYDAPLIDADVFASFHHSPELQSILKTSFIKMLDFYGFKFADDLDENNLPVIIKAPNFDERSGNWLVIKDHNHLRISRILRSLRVLNLEFEAAAFYKAISEIIYSKNGQMVSSQSAEFWRRAAERPLHWEPQMSEDACREDSQHWEEGPDFLKSYQRIKMARDLQQQYDTQRALEEKKEAEFQATKEHISALNAGRTRKVDEANVSPQSQVISSRQDDRTSESQLDKMEDVVADTRELRPELPDVVAEKDQATHDESELVTPKLPESKTSKTDGATNDNSERVGQKAPENVGQSVIHQIQQYQLMTPRQP
ncbi:hypothetical protein NHQ30_002782 [Ciborinia camelliae]|nr:hypothetical protein NHQ30_002782 [Ciborinia camelliae]